LSPEQGNLPFDQLTDDELRLLETLMAQESPPDFDSLE
jgi:hypothetical protein